MLSKMHAKNNIIILENFIQVQWKYRMHIQTFQFAETIWAHPTYAVQPIPCPRRLPAPAGFASAVSTSPRSWDDRESNALHLPAKRNGSCTSLELAVLCRPEKGKNLAQRRIPTWSPTVVLMGRSAAWIWQSGRDTLYSAVYEAKWNMVWVMKLMNVWLPHVAHGSWPSVYHQSSDKITTV